jgi:hypothetical protein
MTFDEAHALAVKAKEKWGGGSSEAWLINVLNALGVIKLDEPKSSPEALVCEVLASMQVYGLRQRQFLDGLASAGLKVVHRSPQESASD